MGLVLIRAFVFIVVAPGSERDVYAELRKISQAVNVDLIYGEFDIVVKVQTETLVELKRMLCFIRGIDKVHSTLTMIVKSSY